MRQNMNAATVFFVKELLDTLFGPDEEHPPMTYEL
jgi:hypothetical protein